MPIFFIIQSLERIGYGSVYMIMLATPGIYLERVTLIPRSSIA